MNARNTTPICIYHANCADGFTAAWLVHSALSGAVELVPASYGDTPPDVKGRDVVIVDFSYKREVLKEIAKVARSILILDHHKTAQEDLAAGDGIVDISKYTGELSWSRHMMNVAQDQIECAPNAQIYVLFDMERSGAQLACDFFFDDNRPMLVEYVADRDLWKWELYGSREVSVVIASHEFTIEVWSELEHVLDFQSSLEDLISEGKAILRKHNRDIRQMLEITKREMVIGGVSVPVANLPYTMASDAAGLMAEDAPFAATYFDGPEGRAFSLRSRGEKGADVSEIAKAYGGGGHRNAAGFKMPIGWEGDAE
ncbi:DHH family phosphoesterase [Roseobacter sp. TSBP12]|uniref:DHH family phosphoesterase n=1 Tax=Roseobacter sp. TSBP12 TaxID=1236613 RepID=UPI00125EEEBE|nr:DHH family phosphoesterase [Roseobacter sp. TSBP12]KAB6717721.1 phosphohydrolase [Roseobacter sp. TSBP12]